MKSVVCIKRVPDTAAEVKIGPDGKSIETSGVEFIINPYDEYALESAVRLKEATGGEITILSLGPAESTKEIRKALAMGADQGILVKADHTGRDPLSVAQALHSVLAGLEFDVLFLGARAVDDDNFQVGPMLSELLGLPSATEVVEVVAGEDGRIVATREAAGGMVKVALPTPCAVTFQKGLHEARFIKLPEIMKAKKKPLDEREIEIPASRLEVLAIESPPARPAGRIVGEGPGAVDELVRLLREEAKVI